MPRLRNAATGVVVNVSEEKAAQLGSTYGPVEQPQPRKSTRRKSESSDSDDK